MADEFALKVLRCRYVLHMMRRGTRAEVEVSVPAARHLNLGLKLGLAT
jgi:hypothetical protein